MKPVPSDVAVLFYSLVSRTQKTIHMVDWSADEKRAAAMKRKMSTPEPIMGKLPEAEVLFS